MTISLKALEGAITQVEKVADQELTFQVNGTNIAIRGLRPDEDTEVQRYAQSALPKNGEEDQAAFAEFMDRLRYGTLGYSVVQINDMDLRNEDYLSTEDEEGAPYDVPKSEALRDMIRKNWSRPMLAAVFKKFVELLNRIEVHADRSVKFDPADLNDEIKRMEERLTELKTTRDEQGKEVQDVITKTQHAVSKINNSQIEHRKAQNVNTVEAVDVDPQQAPVPQQAPEPVSEPEPPRQENRRSSIPQQMAPPSRQAPQPQPQMTSPETPRNGGIPDPHEGHSFMDTSDPEAAIYEEGRRQEMIYQQQQERAAREREAKAQRHEEQKKLLAAKARRPQQRPAGGATDVSQLGGRASKDPGLRQALNTQNAVSHGNQPPIRSAATKPAQLGGKDVYALDAQTLDRRAKQERQGAPAGGIDQPGGVGSLNPRFKGGNTGNTL